MALLLALLFLLIPSVIFGAIQYGAFRLGGKRVLWGVSSLVALACVAYFASLAISQNEQMLGVRSYFAAVADLTSAMIFLQSIVVTLWPIFRIPFQKYQQLERAAEARWAARTDYRSGDQS
jgi:hypothetical protein